jgi:hypothetical protein
MKTQILFLISAIILLVGCSQPTQSVNPAWVDKLIQQFESEQVGNPAQSIWSYEYNGQVVYYIPPQCCDQYSTLYDTSGSVICAPDGGFTGAGDGKCPDFLSKRTNELMIWQDTRTH